MTKKAVVRKIGGSRKSTRPDCRQRPFPRTIQAPTEPYSPSDEVRDVREMLHEVDVVNCRLLLLVDLLEPLGSPVPDDPLPPRDLLPRDDEAADAEREVGRCENEPSRPMEPPRTETREEGGRRETEELRPFEDRVLVRHKAIRPRVGPQEDDRDRTHERQHEQGLGEGRYHQPTGRFRSQVAP